MQSILKCYTRATRSCHFLAERMKVRKVQKLAPHLKEKKTYVIYIKSLNEALKHGLKLRYTG